MQPQPGQTGLPSVSGQRRRKNTFTTPLSDMRMTFAALSERAAADSRKCCAMPTRRTKIRAFLLPEGGPEYKANRKTGISPVAPAT
jgi:hypothetical protein